MSAASARRFLVRRHLLAPPRALPASAESVLAVVARLGSLQFDPLEVPGARNHDLVLHARIAGYRREWCDRWLYGPERRLFEAYNKSLNILPVEELPYYRIAWARAEERYGPVLKKHRKLVREILARIEEEGPLSAAAFAHVEGAIDWHWAPTRLGRALLEALFLTGRIGIARRDRSLRTYDLTERLHPAALLAAKVRPAEAMRHRLLSRFRGSGFLGAVAPPDVVYGTGTATERARTVARLVDEGVLLRARVEGVRGDRFVLAEERGLLEGGTVPPAVTFLAPLDPFVWDRKLLRQLFGFDYVWEVYTPSHKRKHGYYVLPVLFGDRLVARIEPRKEKARDVVEMLGFWPQAGFDLDEPGFVPGLRAAAEAYRVFVGAQKVTWPRRYRSTFQGL